MKPLVKRLAWLALFPPAAVWPSVIVAAPSMSELIRAYDADRSDTAGFYDLLWSAVRLDRLEKLQAGGKPGWRSWISTRSIKRAAWTGCCWRTMCTVRWRSLRAT